MNSTRCVFHYIKILQMMGIIFYLYLCIKPIKITGVFRCFYVLVVLVGGIQSIKV